MRTIHTSIISVAVFSACLVCVGGCSSNSGDGNLPTASISSANDTDPVDSSSTETVTAQPKLSANAATPKLPRKNLYPEVEIKTSVGRIRLKLNAEKAPRTVENFLANYVDRGFYSGTVVHYVERDYIMIAGGYTADLKPQATRTPIRNEARSAPKNLRGTIAMSRDPDYADSATSQFFINLADNDSLDYQESEEGANNGYCVFGEVIQGMDLIDQFASVQVHDVDEFPNVPVDAIVIESISRLDAEVAKRP